MGLIGEAAIGADFDEFVVFGLIELVEGGLELDDFGKLLGGEARLCHEFALDGALSDEEFFS